MILWWLFPGSDCKTLNLTDPPLCVNFTCHSRNDLFIFLCGAHGNVKVVKQSWVLWVNTSPPNRNVRANRARPGTLIQIILHQVGIARPGPRCSFLSSELEKEMTFPLHLSQCCCANWKLKAWIHSKGATFPFSQNLSDHSGGWTSLQKLNQDESQRTFGAGGSFVTLFHL